MGRLGLQQYNSQLIWNHKSKKIESAVKNWGEPELVPKRQLFHLGPVASGMRKATAALFSCHLLLIYSSYYLADNFKCLRHYSLWCARVPPYTWSIIMVSSAHTQLLCATQEPPTLNRASWPDAKANSLMEWVMDWPSHTTPAHHSCMFGSCVTCPKDISIIPPLPWMFSCSQQNTQAESRV